MNLIISLQDANKTLNNLRMGLFMAQNEFIPLQLPSLRHIGKFILWGTGRCVLSGWLFALYGTTVLCKGTIHLAELTKMATLRLIKVYDQLPYMGVAFQNIVDVPAIAASEPEEIITDIITAIEGKQVMVIGEMGTGKSTLAQYLAYTIGGKVKVYECEGTPEDWAGLEVIGKGEDWEAIEAGMIADLEDLSNQMQLRNQKGDSALTGSERVIICEEYPELVSKVDTSGEWLERHARRGRKAKRFTILLSQYDRVSAWGLEGKGDLAEAFYRVRLGKKAVNHAKSLKNDNLVNWLRLDKSHCLIDDQPCKLPSYREMKAVTMRLSAPAQDSPTVTAETITQQGFQPVKMVDNQLPETVKKAVKACCEAGLSDSKIIKEILGYQGAQYHQGREILNQLRSEFK
jgi:energy-coupling factor transporter ATP-binding protein EcfA2